MKLFTPILQQLDNEGFDFQPYDFDQNGSLDHLVVITNGYGAELGIPAADCDVNSPYDRIWSQGFPNIGDGWMSSSGIGLGAVAITSAFDDGLCESKPTEMGLILHEYIHGFGVPDLYDADVEEDAIPLGGTGKFCIMSNQYGWYVRSIYYF